MNIYKITALYTISVEKEVYADSKEEAEEMAYDIEIFGDGNGVYADDASLEADGCIRDVEVHLLEGDEDEEDEEEE